MTVYSMLEFGGSAHDAGVYAYNPLDTDFDTALLGACVSASLEKGWGQGSLLQPHKASLALLAND